MHGVIPPSSALIKMASQLPSIFSYLDLGPSLVMDPSECLLDGTGGTSSPRSINRPVFNINHDHYM